MKFEKYELNLSRNKEGEVTCSLRPEKLDEDEAILYPHRLIYIVQSLGRFLYVGEARSSLKKRFQRGFSSYRFYKRTNTARSGYKGYKWIELFEEHGIQVLDVTVALFPSTYDDDNHRYIVEAIEGEIVWHIRQKTGSWPLYQNEIHFNNRVDNAQQIATEILEHV